MSSSYKAIQWVPQKKVYDTLLAAGTGLYLVGFVAVSKLLNPYADDAIVVMRAFGTGAFLLLHLVLCIGPLARLDKAFLPLLYNRRHLGVTLFLMALVHALVVVLYYHLGGVTNPLQSIFLYSPFKGDWAWMPFQAFGAVALFILFLMAATSHDFWLNHLTAPVWKALHMGVYGAWFLLVVHVSFGILQTEQSPLYVVITLAGTLAVGSLHTVAALRERRADRTQAALPPPEAEGFICVGTVDEIVVNRAKIVQLSGERVAVFKYEDEDDGKKLKLSAVSNVCQHQNGPLGEGKYVFGCLTCPWHSFQYKPHNGAAPAPFTEKIPTFNLRLLGNRIYVHPKPNPPGTAVQPALVEESHA